MEKCRTRRLLLFNGAGPSILTEDPEAPDRIISLIEERQKRSRAEALGIKEAVCEQKKPEV